MRIDGVGWQVDISNKEVEVKRLFNEHYYGSSLKAKFAARAFRNDAFEKLTEAQKNFFYSRGLRR